MTRAQLTSTVEQNSAGAAAPFVAGKNKIINGDFYWSQRGSSISLPTNTGTYAIDRYLVQSNFSAGTSTFAQVAFDYGSSPASDKLPISGYTSTYFGRLTLGSTATYFDIRQYIEDVHTFAGQTVTFSFWAKASASTAFRMYIRQNFGSGGSANVDLTSDSTLTTSWQRFAFTTTLGALTGKTIGAGSFLGVIIGSTGSVTNSGTIDVWGLQVEQGSVATPFTTSSGTLQGELALAQRYYFRIGGGAYSNFGQGYTTSSTNFRFMVQASVTMRITPTALDSSAASTFNPIDSANGSYTPTSITLNSTESDSRTMAYDAAGSGFTAGRYAYNRAANNTGAYIGFTAEL